MRLAISLRKNAFAVCSLIACVSLGWVFAANPVATSNSLTVEATRVTFDPEYDIVAVHCAVINHSGSHVEIIGMSNNCKCGSIDTLPIDVAAETSLETTFTVDASGYPPTEPIRLTGWLFLGRSRDNVISYKLRLPPKGKMPQITSPERGRSILVDS